MFQKMETEDIETLIRSQLTGRIGCHADGVTYVVPISYAYDGTYIYVRTFEGQKLGMLRKNPKVCFQADDTRDLSNWKSVICQGEFEELVRHEEREHAIRILSSRMLPPVSSETMQISPNWPFMPENTDEIKGIFFRIRLTEKTGRCEVAALSSFLH